MVAYLLLPFLIFLVALATLVLAQNFRGQLNWLLSRFLIVTAISVISGLIRLTAPSASWAAGAYGSTLLALAISSLLFTWLIMALFLPRRFDQPAARWLISAPYLLATLLLIVDLIFNLNWFFGGVTTAGSGGYELVSGRYSLAMIVFYMVGRIVPIAMAAVVAVREPRWRVLGGWLVAAMILSLVISSLTGALEGISDFARLLIYVGQVPVFLVLAWATQRSESFRPSNQVLQAAIDSLPDGVLVLDGASQVRYANSAALHLLHASHSDSRPLAEMIAAGGYGSMQSHCENDVQRGRLSDGETILEVTEAAVSGDLVARQILLVRDISVTERQARALAHSRDELRARAVEIEASLAEVERRDEVITNLSLPLIPISQGVTVLPLIGTFDEQRSPQLVERLLRHVEESRTQMVLVDMTGVLAFDNSLALALRQVVGGVRLMGAQIALCGVRPDLAEMIVHENFNWREIGMFATLQDGVQATRVVARPGTL